MNFKRSNKIKRIEQKEDVITYLERLCYSIKSGQAKVTLVNDRFVDRDRDQKYTNRYTLHKLFPDEDLVEALKRELPLLRVEDYIETLKDIRETKRSDFRVFGKKYDGKDVYIKIRVELLDQIGCGGDNHILVISFHFAENNFVDDSFPHKGKRGV
ncbi:MAG: hypothetical protein FJ152_07265 [Firmicutes bacterium]|nr:hypothetical protein [Bacillota bacterium]